MHRSIRFSCLDSAVGTCLEVFTRSVCVLEFQSGQSSTVIENIHTIIAAAAVKFSFDQLTHLFVLIQKVSANTAPGSGSRTVFEKHQFVQVCKELLILCHVLFRVGRLRATG